MGVISCLSPTHDRSHHKKKEGWFNLHNYNPKTQIPPKINQYIAKTSTKLTTPDQLERSPMRWRENHHLLPNQKCGNRKPREEGYD